MQENPEIEISESENDAEFPGEVLESGGCLVQGHLVKDCCGYELEGWGEGAFPGEEVLFHTEDVGDCFADGEGGIAAYVLAIEEVEDVPELFV
jgi:hypothetical protein